MTRRPTPALVPPVEKSTKNVSRLELAANAHRNAVEERDRLRAEVEEARRELEAAEKDCNAANSEVIETGKLLTAAALGKPE